MKSIDEITNLVNNTCKQEFSFVEDQRINSISLSETNLEAVVIVSSIMFLRIKQLSNVINDEGKRVAAKSFRLYRQIAQSFAKQTNAHFEIYDPCSFLLIYPGSKENLSKTVKLAMQLTHILHKSKNEYPEQFNRTDFSIGIDHGRILGTNEGRMIWIGECIEKAKAISSMCIKPYRIGISRLVNSALEESDKIIVTRTLGIPHKQEIWERYSYEFYGAKKHYYVTKHTEAYQPQDDID